MYPFSARWPASARLGRSGARPDRAAPDRGHLEGRRRRQARARACAREQAPEPAERPSVRRRCPRGSGDVIDPRPAWRAIASRSKPALSPVSSSVIATRRSSVGRTAIRISRSIAAGMDEAVVVVGVLADQVDPAGRADHQDVVRVGRGGRVERPKTVAEPTGIDDLVRRHQSIARSRRADEDEPRRADRRIASRRSAASRMRNAPQPEARTIADSRSGATAVNGATVNASGSAGRRRA